MTITWPPRNRSFGGFDVVGLIGLFGLLVARFIPVARWIPFWGCRFRTMTGWPCPGCGLTRAADHLTHFHWLEAIRANPLGVVVYGLFAIAAVWSVLHLAFKVPVPDVQLSDREWKWARNLGMALLVVNYAFVLVQHRTHWL